MRRNELDLNSQPVRNLITNPAFVRVQSGNDAMLTNWAANPSFEGATSYIAGIGGNPATWTTYGIASDKAHSGTKSFKCGVCTVAGQANLKAQPVTGTTLKVLKGQTISWSFWIYSTVAGSVAPYWEGSKVSDGSYTGGGGGAAVSIAANTWSYVTGTSTATFDSYVQGAGGYNLSINVGDSVWWDDFCITTSAEPYPYFDGSTTSTDGYSYAWTGTAYASSSVRKATAYINRTNLFTNPSFEAAGATNNVRTNHATNPSFETAAGTVFARTNLLTNPSMEATSGAVNVRTNLATNPSFETTSGTVNVRNNLITNPSFEASSAPVNVRTNLATNPGFETATGAATVRTNLVTNSSPASATGWSTSFGPGGAGTTAYGAVSGLPSTNGATVTWTTAPTGGWNVQVGSFPVTAGQPFTGSMYGKPSWAGATACLTFQFFDSSGASLGYFGAAQVDTPANTVTRVSQTLTAPANSATVGLFWDSQGVSILPPVNSTFVAGAALLEASPVLLPYFDGSTPIKNMLLNPDFEVDTVYWTTESGATLDRDTANPISGAASGKLLGLNSGSDVYANVVGFKQGDIYTFSIDYKAPIAPFGVQKIRLVEVGGTARYWDTILPTVQASASRFSVTSQPIGAGVTNLVAVVSHSTNNQFVWFDNAMAEPASQANPYYKGQGDFTYAWTGVANASTSIQQGPALPTASGAAAAVVQSTMWDGHAKSARLIPQYKTPGSSYTDFGGITWQTGVTYSASLTYYMPKAQTVAGTYGPVLIAYWYLNGVYGQALMTQPQQTAATSKDGRLVSVTWSFPAGATSMNLRFRADSQMGDSDVWFDNFLVEEAGSVSPYFDGSTPAAGDFTYIWLGTPNASVSYQQAPGITGAGWNNRWYGNAGGSGVLYQGKGGISGNYARKLWKTANTGGIQDTGINPDAWISVNAGWNYTLSAWVRSSVDQYFNFYIAWKDSANADLPASMGPSVLVPANMWTRLSTTSVAPSAATTALPVPTPYVGAVAMPAGATLDFDNVLFERTTSMLPYFDGSTPERINRLYGVGFAALQVEGAVSNYTWGGRTWQKLDNSVPTTFRAWSSKSYFPDGTYIDASVEVANPTGSTVYFTLDLGDSGSVVNVPVNPYASFRVATSAATRAVDNLAFLDVSPNTTLLVRNPFMEIRQGSSAAPYFDGASDSDYTYTWSGVANASWSAQQAPTYADSPSLWNDTEIFRKSQPLALGTKSARILCKAAGTIIRQLPLVASGASRTVTVSLYVRPSITLANVRIGISTFTDAAGTTGRADTSPVTYTNCPAGTITRVSQTFTTTATTLSLRPYLNVEQSIAAGEFIDIDDLLIEEEGTVNTYFDGSNPITNLISNSSFETDTSGWGANTGSPTIGISPDVAKVGTKSMKATTTTTSADCAVTFNATLVPNTTYTVSWYVYSNDARTNCWVDVAGTGYTLSNAGTKSIPAREWTRISATFTTSQDITGITAFYLHHSGGPTPAGASIYIDAALLERASTANPYYAGAGDVTTLWVGVADASTSVQQAPMVAGYGRNNGGNQAWSSSTYSLYGGKSIASRSLGWSVYNGIISSIGSLTVGQTYTFSAWVYMPTALYGNGVKCVVNGGGMATTEGNPFTRVGEWGRVSLSFTPADATPVNLYIITGYTDTPAAGQTFFTDGWMLEQSPVVGSYFDGTNTLKNLCLNGSFDTDISGWNVVSPSARDTSKSYSGSASLKVDPSLAGAYAGAVYYPSVIMNRTYTVSAKVWIPSGTFVNFACDNLISPPQTITGNSAWQAISMTGYAGTPGFPVYLRSLADNQPAFWVDEVLIEESSTVSPFYTGSGDYTYFWSGTPDASASVQQAIGVADIASSAAAYQSTGFTGTGSKSLRITPTGTSNDTYVAVGGDTQGMRLGMAAGGTYTVSATGRLDRPMVSTFDRYKRIVVFYNAGVGYQSIYSNTLPNVAGSARVSLTFTLPAGTTEAFIRLYNGASAGDADIWWDDFVLEENVTDGSYFDGSTPAAGDFTYAWTGTANASTSVQQAPMPTGTDEVATLAKAYQSKTVGITGAGSKSIRITPTNISNGDSFAELGPMLSGVTFKPNTTYTISGDRTILAPQTNLGGTTHFRINIGGELTPTIINGPVNTAGTTRVVARFTTGTVTTLAFMRIYNGSYAGGGDVWWDNIQLDEGVTDGTYFDGSTSSKAGVLQRWTGTANASTSEQYAVRLEGYGLEANIFSSKLTDGAVRVTNKAGTTHSFQSTPNCMVIGRTYTLLFRAKTYNGGYPRIYRIGSEPPVPLTSSYAWYRVSGVAQDTRCYFSTQGSVPGAGFDISHMMVVEGTYTKGYVDGSQVVARWDGSPDASTSVGMPT